MGSSAGLNAVATLFPYLCQESNLGRPARSLVTVLTALQVCICCSKDV